MSIKIPKAYVVFTKLKFMYSICHNFSITVIYKAIKRSHKHWYLMEY